MLIAADFPEAFAITTVIEKTGLPFTVALDAVAFTETTVEAGSAATAASPVKWNSTMSAISIASPTISGKIWLYTPLVIGTGVVSEAGTGSPFLSVFFKANRT